jgi:diguanylate cyclase (GGDEF)-like protein
MLQSHLTVVGRTLVHQGGLVSDSISESAASTAPSETKDSELVDELLSSTRVHLASVRVSGKQIVADVPRISRAAGFSFPGTSVEAIRFWAAISDKVLSAPPEARDIHFPVALTDEAVAVRMTRTAENAWAIVWSALSKVWTYDSAAQVLPDLVLWQLATVLVHADGTIVSWNQQLLELLGLAAKQDLAARDVRSILPRDMTPGIGEVLAQVSSGVIVDRLLATVTPEPRWFRVRANRPVQALSATAIHVLQIEEVTRSEDEERTLVDQVIRDPLTGLYNRRAFFDIAGLDDPAASPFVGVLFADIRRFKSINELWGQFAADQCLVEVATWLRSITRPADVVVRLAGDEFMVLCTDSTTLAGEVARVGERLSVGSQRIPIALQAGWADREKGEPILATAEHAERALTAAKRQTWRTVLPWTQEISDAAHDRIDAEESVRRAIGAREVSVHFQPQVDLEAGKVIGVEALVRLLGAAEHIPAERIVEASHQLGLTPQLAPQVFDVAFQQGKLLRKVFPGIDVGVNISREFLGTGLALDAVVSSAAAAGLNLDDIVIELTEEFAESHSQDRLLAELHRGVDLGLTVVIDDFGRGETSLSLLRSLPIAGIKLDRSLVPSDQDDQGWAFVEGTASLLRTLTDTLIAEGVETERQAKRLHEIGISVQQGFFFGRPAPFHYWLEHPIEIPAV